MGEEIPLDPSVGIFITMNPGIIALWDMIQGIKLEVLSQDMTLDPWSHKTFIHTNNRNVFPSSIF